MEIDKKLRGRSSRAIRNEREELGFVRQREVRWLTPSLLLRSGVEVLVSGTFGKFADKREILTAPQDLTNYSGAEELWIDYISDTGDGFDATYTIAWLLAQEELHVKDKPLPRGMVLLLGGDQVYPSATAEAYEDRFSGPFAAALPHSENEALAPELYAVPGNHDWYDGLVSFLRAFCTGRWIGGWRTSQRRSYFALALPNNWWIWAIDIQLDTFIDEVQLQYFKDQGIGPGDKVLLLTAKPAWTKAYTGRVEPNSWRYLSFFEDRYVRATGARLVLTLTGDTHHYARYEPSGEGSDRAPTRITAGGGGAYLSATHTLKTQLRLLSHDAKNAGEQPVTYTRKEVYPSADVSHDLGRSILKLALRNPGFAGVFAAVYALMALAMLGALSVAGMSLAESRPAGGFLGMLAGSADGLSIVLAVVIFGAALGSADIVAEPLERSRAKRWLTPVARWITALVHTAVHVALAGAAVWLALELAPDESFLVWALALALGLVVGGAGGTTVFAIFMLFVHRIRGARAPRNANEVFTGQSIADYKNLLRIHVRPDGGLTIYPLGVDRVGRDWTYVGKRDDGPWFEPGHGDPVAQLIEEPLQFDDSGARSP